MKALTVYQPFASLIVLPDSDPRRKRHENRKWYTDYRGPLLIHAGKSRDWLDESEDGTLDESWNMPIADMPFGAIVGVCRMIDCPRAERLVADYSAYEKADEQHIEGPYCWTLTDVRKFESPIPWKGAQGLFDIPVNGAVEDALVRCGLIVPAVRDFSHDDYDYDSDDDGRYDDGRWDDG